MSDRLDRHQAMILGAFTGVLCGPFEDLQRYAERLMRRPVYTHEFADEGFAARLKELACPDFMDLVPRMGDRLEEA